MELSDVISAQVVSSGQLKAIRDKIVVDKQLLRRAVLSLFPNFDVNDPANMQELETNLVAQYPEVAPALRSLRLNSSISQREAQFKVLSRRRDPNGSVKIEIDITNFPSESVAFEDFRRKAVSLLNYKLETERLKKIKSNSEKKVNRLV